MKKVVNQAPLPAAQGSIQEPPGPTQEQGTAMRPMNEKFADLGLPRRIWAIGAICGDKDRLAALHDHLATRFAVRDQLIYMGQYVGATASPDVNNGTLDEILAFRAALLSKNGIEPSDFVYLRGPAEEAWQRLLRLQFTPVPTQTLEKLLDAGAEAYLRLYGQSVQEARSIARAGSVSITRWTNHLRNISRLSEGHEPLFCSMRRAAFTSDHAADLAEAGRVLFVPAGFRESMPLEDQGDNLWFGGAGFSFSEDIAEKYSRIVRGYDPRQVGISTETLAVTLDGGAGRGGPLVCGCFDTRGRLREIVAVGGRGAVESIPFKDRVQAEPKLAPFTQPPLAAFWGAQTTLSASN